MGHWPKHVGLASLLATVAMLFSAQGAGAATCLTCPGDGGGGGPSPDPTTTSVVATPSQGQFGQTVTFKATVTDSADSSATPTGTVTFHDGSASDTVALSGGTANYSVTPPLGSTTVTADYTPSSTAVYLPSSGSGTATIGQDFTATAVSSAKNPSAYADSVTFTATVSATYDSPTGSVTFRDGSTTLGTASLSGGKATYTTSQLAPGAHSITAVYGGDTNNAGSSSSSTSQTVNQDATATSLSSGVNPASAGQAVTLTATIANTDHSSLAPSGSVTFMDGSANLGTVSLNNGQASLTTSALGVGSHNITASYGGATDFAPSSNGLTQVIVPASSSGGTTSSSGGSTSSSGGSTNGSGASTTSSGTSGSSNTGATSNPAKTGTSTPKGKGAKCVKVSKKKGKKAKGCSKPKPKHKKKGKKH